MTAAHPLPTPGDELDVAPLDLADFTPEEQVEIQASLASLAARRSRLSSHEDVERALEAKRRQQGG
jgi:hypothetical protein